MEVDEDENDKNIGVRIVHSSIRGTRTFDKHKVHSFRKVLVHTMLHLPQIINSVLRYLREMNILNGICM